MCANQQIVIRHEVLVFVDPQASYRDREFLIDILMLSIYISLLILPYVVPVDTQLPSKLERISSAQPYRSASNCTLSLHMS
jgi:hypothetical protein